MKKIVYPAKLLRSGAAISIFVICCLFTVSPVFAQTPAPPNPQPCKDALFTDQVTKSLGEPKLIPYEVTGKIGDTPHIEQDVQIDVDFSALESLFAKSNSDSIESNSQDPSHQQENLLGLSSPQFNSYFGPGQKIEPRIMVDQLRQKYIDYVYKKPTLPEASSKYTDINGKNPKTVYDLYNQFGTPKPPSDGGSQDNWVQTWGQYWDKIPTAVNEFFYGKLTFPVSYKTNKCPQPNSRIIYFVMPEFYRTASLTNQLNLVLVPKAAQSTIENQYPGENFPDSTLKSATNGALAIVSDIIAACIKPFTENPLAKALQKVVKISLNFINPIKNVYAYNFDRSQIFGQPEKECITIPVDLPKGKPGSAPFCSLPELAPTIDGVDKELAGKPQIQRDRGEKCDTQGNYSNKLDAGTQVVCHFMAHISYTYKIKDPKNKDPEFEHCDELGGQENVKPEEKQYKCSVTIRVYPAFYIPWLGRIWNNTTYSDTDKTATDGEARAIFGIAQKTGQPGFYTIMAPNSLDKDIFPDGKKKPGQTNDTALKQRYSGAFDCAGQFIKNIALKPKIVQEAQGIKSLCSDFGAPIPGTNPTTQDNCGGKYELKNPLGNFGDSSCNFSFEGLSGAIQKQDPSNLSNWLSIIALESYTGPNAYNAAAIDPQGAWGLVQMGRGRNGQYDHGDVP